MLSSPAHQPTHFPVLVFPYTETSSLLRTKSISLMSDIFLGIMFTYSVNNNFKPNM